MREKLLFIVNDVEFFISHRLNIAYAASNDGWDIHVAAPPSSSIDKLRSIGFQFHNLPLTRRRSNLIQEFCTVLAIWRLLRRLKPQLVHAVTIKPVLYTGLVARAAGVPALVQAVSGLGHVFTAKGCLASARKLTVNGAYYLAFCHPNSRVILQNPEDLSTLRFALRKNQAVLILGAGVDPNEFDPFGESRKPLTAVLVARMLWSKGVGDFVKAAELLKNRGLDASFVLVGPTDPENPESISEQQLREWHAEGCVEWWGKRSDISEIFKRAAVICLPTYYGEGVPKVLIEAAAAARPIVATNWPGCREIVDDGQNGLLVEPHNPMSIANALQVLLEDETLRAKMGVCGRKKMLDGFTSDQVVAKTLAIYNTLSNKRPGSS